MIYYADDIIVTSRSQGACAKLLGKTERISAHNGLRLSKGKFVKFKPEHKGTEFQNGAKHDKATEATYLGNTLNIKNSLREETEKTMQQVI